MFNKLCLFNIYEVTGTENIKKLMTSIFQMLYIFLIIRIIVNRK